MKRTKSRIRGSPTCQGRPLLPLRDFWQISQEKIASKICGFLLPTHEPHIPKAYIPEAAFPFMREGHRIGRYRTGSLSSIHFRRSCLCRRRSAFCSCRIPTSLVVHFFPLSSLPSYRQSSRLTTFKGESSLESNGLQGLNFVYRASKFERINPSPFTLNSRSDLFL